MTRTISPAQSSITQNREPLPITASERERLISGAIVRITHRRATLAVLRRADNQLWFQMQGPSGQHSLMVIATDTERLNAHWRGFATDARNQ